MSQLLISSQGVLQDWLESLASPAGSDVLNCMKNCANLPSRINRFSVLLARNRVHSQDEAFTPAQESIVDKTRLPIQFEASRDFVRMTLSPDITQVPWNVVEECGDKAISKLQECRASALLVDLTSLEFLGSAQVALLARIWKALSAQQGTMAVQVASPVVREVLKTAGLHRLWKLVESQEQGLQKLGVNATGMHVVPTRWTIAPGLTAIACLLLSTIAWKGPADWRFWSGWGAILLGSLAVFLSRRAIIKAEQGQRALGVLSLLVGLGAVAAGVYFTWPRSELDAKIVDPELAAGVRVHDPEGFGGVGDSPDEVQSPPNPTSQSPSEVSPTPSDPPADHPVNPQSPGDPGPRSAPARVDQTTATPPHVTPSPDEPDPKSVEPVSAQTTPDAAAVDQSERPEPPSEPVDLPETP
jgi:anti-anti-sigma factor